MGSVGGSYSYNATCDVCGFQFKAAELRKRWDGLMVCSDDFEHRHPMDFYKVKSDHHTLPFTRKEAADTLYDPYLVPHPESFYPNFLTDVPVIRSLPAGGAFLSTSWWTPTTTVTVRGFRWWVHPDQVDQDPSNWRFRVMDYLTRTTAVGAIVPKKRFRPGWNHILFTDADILSQVSITKQTFYEGQHFQLEMVRHVKEIATPYWVQSNTTLFPTYTTIEDGYGSCGWYTDQPALVQRARQYYNSGTYGVIPIGYPINQSTADAEIILEPIFEVVTPVDNSGIWDKRYTCAFEWLPVVSGVDRIYANKFTCNRSRTVTALRFYANDLGTYSYNGSIGIMQLDGTPVTSVALSLPNSFRWTNHSVTPVTLQAGATYWLYHLTTAAGWNSVQDNSWSTSFLSQNTDFTLNTSSWYKNTLAAEVPTTEVPNSRMALDIVTT